MEKENDKGNLEIFPRLPIPLSRFPTRRIPFAKTRTDVAGFPGRVHPANTRYDNSSRKWSRCIGHFITHRCISRFRWPENCLSKLFFSMQKLCSLDFSGYAKIRRKYQENGAERWPHNDLQTNEQLVTLVFAFRRFLSARVYSQARGCFDFFTRSHSKPEEIGHGERSAGSRLNFHDFLKENRSLHRAASFVKHIAGRIYGTGFVGFTRSTLHEPWSMAHDPWFVIQDPESCTNASGGETESRPEDADSRTDDSRSQLGTRQLRWLRR